MKSIILLVLRTIFLNEMTALITRSRKGVLILLKTLKYINFLIILKFVLKFFFIYYYC